MNSTALAGLRICDLSGQLAGAGATRTLAAFGAEVIRIEDPVRKGKWDLLRGVPPFREGQRGIDAGGAFNNHNVGKQGITLNTRTERGKELLAELVSISDVVTENFSAEVMESWGFGYERLCELRPGVIYVSNCGFGHTGPYRQFRTWGPIVQAVCGLTWSVGQADQPSAGFGFSYMDHHGANLMVFAILAALHHRRRTGEGQWIDMSTVESGAAMLGPMVLDFTVNGRPARRPGMPASNRGHHPLMAPHGIHPALGDDEWVAVVCRTDAEWATLASILGVDEPAWATVDARLAAHDALDERVSAWTRRHDKFEVQARLLAAGIPAAAVQSPQERTDRDSSTARWGLFPEVTHSLMGAVRVDGIPLHLSATDWSMSTGAPMLGQHNHQVLAGLLGLDDDEIARLEADGVI